MPVHEYSCVSEQANDTWKMVRNDCRICVMHKLICTHNYFNNMQETGECLWCLDSIGHWIRWFKSLDKHISTHIYRSRCRWAMFRCDFMMGKPRKKSAPKFTFDRPKNAHTHFMASEIGCNIHEISWWLCEFSWVKIVPNKSANKQKKFNWQLNNNCYFHFWAIVERRKKKTTQ